MIEQRLRDLMDRAASAVSADPATGSRAWREAHARRSRWGVVVAAGLAAAVLIVAVAVVTDRGRSPSAPQPAPAPTAAQPTPTSRSGSPTTADRRLVDRFVTFAVDPSPETARTVPFATEGVRIGVGKALTRTVIGDQVADPEEWRLPVHIRGRDGDFSALKLIRKGSNGDQGADGHRVVVGQHKNCVSPPVQPPKGVDDLRRISVQPQGRPMCLDWYTVDLFVTADGTIEAVTFDLGEP